MGEQRLPAPPVTIRDPSRGPLAAQVDDASPLPRSAPPRGAVTLALLLLLAAVVGGSAVRDRLSAADEDAAAAAQVLLHAEAEGTSARHEPHKGTSDMAFGVRLRNDGERDVTVVDGELAGFTLRSELRLPAGAEARLLLRRTVSCPPRLLAVEDRAGVLALQVRTDGGVRRAEVPLVFPVTDELLAQGCGFGPAERQVSVRLVRAALEGPALQLLLEVRTTSLRPVQVQAVLVGPGLRSTALGTEPLDLPVPEPGSSTRTRLDVRATVSDCAAARSALATSGGVVTLAMTDEVLNVFAESADYDPSLLRALVASACPG